MAMTPTLETYFQQARASLQQSLSWYSGFQRHGKCPPNLELQGAVKPDLQTLKKAADKLEQKLLRIALFGLVSRGKSAVINALVGQKILDTGPLHGVTRWPRSVAWNPLEDKLNFELIDTPGLDEISGQARADMAREMAMQADLVLFVVAGDVTQSEYEAIAFLRQLPKPLILVFNKIDLYPETDRQAIYQQLQKLADPDENWYELIVPEAIVMVAAEPQPLPVRVEWPDGRVTQEWESPPPQIENLKNALLTVAQREGRTILALNALLQAQQAETNIARKTIALRQEEAEEIIWQYTKYKALVVALNPLAFLDVIGGAIADLALIRSLAKLYGLPMTSYQAGKIWQKILLSSGGLLLGEIGTSLFLGVGKSATAIGGGLGLVPAAGAYASTAFTQSAIAAYGAYTVGKAAETYLKNGCSWGAFGTSTVIQNILQQVEPETIIARLREELS